MEWTGARLGLAVPAWATIPGSARPP